MATNIGTISVNRYSVQKDEVSYARAAHSVSHTDLVTVRRTLGSAKNPALRSQVRFDRGFAPTNVNDTVEKIVTVSIAVTTHGGIDEAAAKAYVKEALTQSADTVAAVAWTGDVHLGE